jgi:hypothetical protein
VYMNIKPGILLQVSTGRKNLFLLYEPVVLIALPPVRVIVAHFSETYITFLHLCCGLKRIMAVLNLCVFILGVFNVFRLP